MSHPSLISAAKLVSIALLCAATLTAVPTPHGGSYRGPGNTVPPGSGAGSGSSAPGADEERRDVVPTPAPKTGGTAPVAPGPTVPVPGPTAGIGRTPRGIMIGEDLSKWQFWWEFNKDRYLLLRKSVHASLLVAGSDEAYMGPTRKRAGRVSTKPSAADIDKGVVPALRAALDATSNRDITSGCLVALAKIGRSDGTFDLLKLFERYLPSHDQEIRETAALAMGISQDAKAIDTLIALATDDQLGRALTKRARVDGRTRAFAAYGMGLIAHAHQNVRLRFAVHRAARKILRDETIVDRNVKVASISALSLFVVDKNGPDVLRTISRDAATTLLEDYDTDRGRGRDVIRAHVPTAVARLIGRDGSPLARSTMKRLADELKQLRTPGVIARSAALAIGQLAQPGEVDKADLPYLKALQAYFRTGKDGQARYFSLIALAQIGGAANQAFLLGVLSRGSRSLEQPWAALALGMMHHESVKRGGPPDPAIGSALHKAFRAASAPYARGATAIGLGLCGYQEAAADLLKHLESHGHQDEMSGYVCVGLALMGHDKALQPIIDVLDNSVRRPHRMRMASVALGKLGDRRLTRRLISILKEQEPSLAKMAAVASALAQIGDRESIEPLRKMLMDDSLPNITRAFAAVALGGIADKEPVPWNAKIAINMNYRAAVETLVESGAGVLEIL